MIRRLGYLNSDNDADKHDTGFYSDDDDVEESKGYECDSLFKYRVLREVTMRYRFTEFNNNTIDHVCSQEYKDKLKRLDQMEGIEINYQADLIRQRTSRDPGGRGSKLYKDVLRGKVEVVAPDGTIVRKGKHSTKK